MCFNCGCHIPDDNMGHEDNITTETFNKLASELGKEPKDIKKMFEDYIEGKEVVEKEKIEEIFQKASKAWGQPENEAKKNTLSMLKEGL
jgi:hypothetical protein